MCIVILLSAVLVGAIVGSNKGNTGTGSVPFLALLNLSMDFCQMTQVKYGCSAGQR